MASVTLGDLRETRDNESYPCETEAGDVHTMRPIIPRFSKSLAWPGLSRSDAYLAVFFVDFTYGKYPLVVLFNIPSRAGKLIIIHH